MRRLSALVVVVAAVLLAGCSAISAGVITEKVHEPARTFVTISYCGKGCMVPITHYDDEDWRLDLKQGETTGFVYVDEATFDAVEVGNYYGPKEKD